MVDDDSSAEVVALLDTSLAVDETLEDSYDEVYEDDSVVEKGAAEEDV